MHAGTLVEFSRGMEQRLHASERNIRLHFSLGGVLLLLALWYGIIPMTFPIFSNTPVPGSVTVVVLFLVGSIAGFMTGVRLTSLAMPRLIDHVSNILVDRFLLTTLLDRELPVLTEIQGNRLFSINKLFDGHRSISERLTWIVNNWSTMISLMGVNPLTSFLTFLHWSYLLLIVVIPITALTLQSYPLLLALGTVYILGISLDAIECNAVRRVLLNAMQDSRGMRIETND